MGRRSDHSREEIREMAVSAAESILRQEGIAGLSTRKVAKAIGYTVGTLYLTFRNLDDLILHVNAKTLDELHRLLSETSQNCDDASTCLHALGSAYFQFAQQHFARWSLLYEHQAQDDAEIPVWFTIKVKSIFELIERQLASLSPKKSSTQVQLSAQVLWSGVHGVCVLNMKDKLSVVSDINVETLIDEFISIFLAGYTADGQ